MLAFIAKKFAKPAAVFHQMRHGKIHMAPTITVTPNDCLADQDVEIHLCGLQAYQDVTIHASVHRDDIGMFSSFSHYIADNGGVVNLTRDASIGGSYTGIEPMGLFWSMKPSLSNDRKQDRFFIRHVEKPVEVSFKVFDSHLSSENFFESENENPLVNTYITRRFQGPGVKRISVRWKTVRGTLFVPEGKGPFPTLIDSFGTAGGIVEYRSALLASRGYQCLALAVFAYDDLPKTIWDVNLEYVEEAKEFLQTLPETNKDSIGILGTSFGGTLALASATYIPGFRCAISIGGLPFAFIGSIHYKDRLWKAAAIEEDKLYRDNGAIVFRHCFDSHYSSELLDGNLIEINKVDVAFLFIFSEDDMSLNIEKAVMLTKKLIKNGKGTYKIIMNPQAGHLLEPPPTPHCSDTFVKIINDQQKWGGVPRMHAHAQEKSWKEVLTFLNQHLANNTSKL